MSSPAAQPTQVFKILSKEQWETWQRDGEFKGAAIDTKDGYIHLSTDEQVVETYEKYFKDSGDIVLVAVDLSKVGDDVKWEPSRGGQLFPHVYGVIGKDAVISHVEGWKGDEPKI